MLTKPSSSSFALAGSHLTGGLQPPNICWKISIERCRQSRRFLDCIEDNFLSQVIDSPTRGNMILDLIVTDKSKLISDIKIGGSLGCSGHALVGFTVLREMGKVRSIVSVLGSDRTGLIFTRSQERTQPGGLNQPGQTEQGTPYHVLSCWVLAGGSWAEASELWLGRARQWQAVRVALWVLLFCFVYSPYL